MGEERQFDVAPAPEDIKTEVYKQEVERLAKAYLDGIKPITEEVKKSKFKKGAKAAGKMFEAITGASFQATLLTEFMDILSPLNALLSPFISIFSAFGKAFIGGFVSQLMPLLTPVMGTLTKFIPLGMKAGQVVGKAVKWFVGEGGFMWAIGQVWVFVKDTSKWLAKKWLEIQNIFLGPVRGILNVVKPVLAQIQSFFLNPVEAIKTRVQFLLGKIKDFFLNPVEAIKTGVRDGLSALGDIINQVLINPINNAINTINKIPGVNLGKIPKLEKGGVITELHPPEMVVPLDRADEFGFGGNEEIVSLLEELISIQKRQGGKML